MNLRELSLSLPKMSKNIKPRYLRIAEALRCAIMQGQLIHGEPLPSTRQLARTLNVHRHTIMAALEELIAEGWLIAKQRQRYEVSKELPSRFFSPDISGSNNKSKPAAHRWRIARVVSTDTVKNTKSDSIKFNFQSGLPDLRLFPYDELRSCLSDAFKFAPSNIMGYGNASGHPPFIEAVKNYLRRIRAVSDREIIVTHGSQEGIYLIAQLLIRPGDVVAVERLGYPPAWEALKAAGAVLAPIDIDNEGLDPDSLEKLLKKKRLRLIYVTPLHQYPTTVTLAIGRRMRLYELAASYGVPILEDDYDHEFHYRSQPLAPLASRDPAEQVTYVSTFSKILYPSARLGFIAAPAVLAQKLTDFKRIASRQNDFLLQDAVARWMLDGGFEKHLRKMRRLYELRRETILACINKGIERGLPLACQEPDGGMAVWLKTGTNSAQLMQRLARRGVHAVSGSLYSLKPCIAEHLRLGFANQTPEEISAGMDIILDCIKR